MVSLIIRENLEKIENFSKEYSLRDSKKDFQCIYKDAIFFDLEHYVYKKPICIGVFGCCYYDEELHAIKTTQYMIENKKDALTILHLGKKYFQDMYKKNKRHIVTFAGNNDFTMINYLFEKYNIDYDIKEHFTHVDLQREYEKVKKTSIGLKMLEKEFNIERESELISGHNLAKTFAKVIKDNDYINRMPDDKKEKILLYNRQDVVSLFYMCVNWFKIIEKE